MLNVNAGYVHNILEADPAVNYYYLQTVYENIFHYKSGDNQKEIFELWSFVTPIAKTIEYENIDLFRVFESFGGLQGVLFLLTNFVLSFY